MFQYGTEASLQALTNNQLQSLLDSGYINGIHGYSQKTCGDAAALLPTGSSQAGSIMAHCKWGTTQKSSRAKKRAAMKKKSNVNGVIIVPPKIRKQKKELSVDWWKYQ